MTELTFELKEDQLFIELNKVLQILNIAQTGGHAKILIQNEEVMVNNTIETRIRKKLYKGDFFTVDHQKVEIR